MDLGTEDTSIVRSENSIENGIGVQDITTFKDNGREGIYIIAMH